MNEHENKNGNAANPDGMGLVSRGAGLASIPMQPDEQGSVDATRL